MSTWDVIIRREKVLVIHTYKWYKVLVNFEEIVLNKR